MNAADARRLHRQPARRPAIAGFTVIEITVTLAIAMVIGLATLTLLKDVFTANSILADGLTAQTQLRGVLRTMTTQMRKAATADDGAYPIAEAGAAHVVFFSDTDRDSVRERLRYFMDGTTLKLGVIEPSGEPLAYDPDDETVTDVVHHVTNVADVFAYYDNNYDGTTAPLAAPIDIPLVRMIRVTLSVDRWTARTPDPISLTSAVTLRNLKVNP
jgi:hypothetical protein